MVVLKSCDILQICHSSPHYMHMCHYIMVLLASLLRGYILSSVLCVLLMEEYVIGNRLYHLYTYITL